MLILERMRQLVRKEHLAGQIALDYEFRETVAEADIDIARDQDHFLPMGIVETGDLAFEQLERFRLQVDPARIQTHHRSGFAFGLQLRVGVFARDLFEYRLLGLVGRHHDYRYRALEAQFAQVLDSLLDFPGLVRVDRIAANQRVGASAQDRQQQKCGAGGPGSGSIRPRRAGMIHEG